MYQGLSTKNRAKSPVFKYFSFIAQIPCPDQKYALLWELFRHLTTFSYLCRLASCLKSPLFDSGQKPLQPVICRHDKHGISYRGYIRLPGSISPRLKFLACRSLTAMRENDSQPRVVFSLTRSYVCSNFPRKFFCG